MSKNVGFVLLSSLLLHFITIILSSYSSLFGFYQPIKLDVIVYSSIDLMLSILIVYLIRYSLSSYFEQAEEFFKVSYNVTIRRYWFLFVALVFIAAYEASQSISLIIMGAARQDLLGEYDRGTIIYMILSGIFKVMVPCVLYFKSDLLVKIIIVTGLIFTLMITASRSELMYVLYFYVVLMLFPIHKSNLLRVALICLSTLSISVIVTIFLQGRPISEGLYAIVDLVRGTFLYRAYAFYLSEYSISVSHNVDKVFFGFFGYVSEYIMRLLTNPDVPIDSAFVGGYQVLGRDNYSGLPYLANVLYPWWSWFYGAFGIFGLIIKAIYEFFILKMVIKLNLLLTTMYLLTFILFGTTSAHPFLTLTHTMSFIMCLALDIFVVYFCNARRYLN